VEKLVELTGRHHARLAAVISDPKKFEDVHHVLVMFIRLVLDRAHVLEEAIKVADEAAACGALDVGVHGEWLYYRAGYSILSIYRHSKKCKIARATH
jgi:hypothetical protein